MLPVRQAQTGLFKGMNPRVTTASIAIIIVAVALGAYGGEQTRAMLQALRAFLTPMLEWYYVLLVATLLLLMIWLGVGRRMSPPGMPQWSSCEANAMNRGLRRHHLEGIVPWHA